MNTIQTYVPARNSIGQYSKIYFAKAQAIAKVTAKVLIISYLVISFLSLFATWYLLKQNYVFTCRAEFDGIQQNWDLGHLMSKDTCNELVSDHLANLTQK